MSDLSLYTVTLKSALSRLLIREMQGQKNPITKINTSGNWRTVIQINYNGVFLMDKYIYDVQNGRWYELHRLDKR